MMYEGREEKKKKEEAKFNAGFLSGLISDGTIPLDVLLFVRAGSISHAVTGTTVVAL